MTYEDRLQYRELQERCIALKDRLDEGEPEESVTREEARELVDLLQAVVDRSNPDRWDQAMDVIAEEAARRAGRIAPSRG